MHVQRFEYRVVPAPRRGEKVKGARTVEDRFAVALARVMNDLGADGWEYLRADTLPCEERVGLTGKATHFHHMLVFRRALAVGATAAPPPPAVALTADAPAGQAPALPPATAAVPGPTPAVGPAVGPLVAPQASTRPPAG